MGAARPPRRAVFTADLRNGYRYFGRSPGWPGEAAALDAVRLLDSEMASLEVSALAGFFCADSETWIVVRGGVEATGNGEARYWREAFGLDSAHLARLRWNPFRLIDEPVTLSREPRPSLAVPTLPPPASAQDDLARIRELSEQVQRTPGGTLEQVLAAVIEAQHTLLTGSTLTPHALELLVLLLPPSLRPQLTFHAHALSRPLDPLPRLVLTPLADDDAFDSPRPVWGHRLPRTAPDVAPEAALLAKELFALLRSPERLVETHTAYERYRARCGDGVTPLGRGVAAASRFARILALRDTEKTSAGLRVLEESIAAHEGTHHPEPLWLARLLQGVFPPAALGAAVAEDLRGPGQGAGATLLLERFAARRQKRPAEFAAFTRRVEQGIGGVAFSRNEQSTRRARTMLTLFAASRGDVAATLTALPVPLDAAVVRRLGGADAWLSDQASPMATLLRAFCATDEAGGVLTAIEALDSVRSTLPQGAEQLRLVEIAVALTRLQFRQLEPPRWREALPAAAAAFDLAARATTSARISLSGRPDHEHIRELLSRSMNPGAPLEAEDRSDAELFLGFLGLDASRERLARREVEERGEALAACVLERVRQADDETACGEAAHWSLALLARVAAGQLDAAHVGLAVPVLRAAVSEPGELLRDFVDEHPAVAAPLLTFTSSGQLFAPPELAAVAAAALAESAGDAAQRQDPAKLVALSEQLRTLNVRLDSADITPAVEPRLRALGDALRAGSSRPFTQHLATLGRAFTPVMDDAALVLARSALQGGRGAVATATTPVEPPASGRSGLPLHLRRLRGNMRRALPLLGAAAFGMLAVLFSSETGRRAIFGPVGGGALARVLPVADPGQRLDQARSRAASDDWTAVVELLSGHTLDRLAPHAFAWDSLLAYAALRRGQRMQTDDVRRLPLLGLARDRAGRALELAAVSGASEDLQRLIRAEACVSGAIGCDPAVVLEDLELAARSDVPVVADRARRILELLE